MKMSEDIPIEKPIAKPTKEDQTKEEIAELIEEIKEENKEFLDIVKTKEYLIFYNALKRVLANTTIKIEIVNSENISRPPGEKSSAAEKSSPAKKETKIDSINYAILKDYSEKAWKLWNRAGLVAYIPKSCVEKTDDDKVYLTDKAKNWYNPEWKEDK